MKDVPSEHVRAGFVPVGEAALERSLGSHAGAVRSVVGAGAVVGCDGRRGGDAVGAEGGLTVTLRHT